MSDDRQGFATEVPEPERERLRELVRAFRGTRFDANDVLARALNLGVSNNSVHVAQAIRDLQSQGELREIDGTNPPEWVFADESGPSGEPNA